MNFAWDEYKSRENIRKHGLDFIGASKVFSMPMLIYLDTREDYGEDRWSGLGVLDGLIVKVIYTETEDETIRIISLRKP